MKAVLTWCDPKERQIEKNGGFIIYANKRGNSPLSIWPEIDSEKSDGWETVEDDEEREDSDVEEELKKKCRNEVAAELWCTCTHCQQKVLSIECICCKELDETTKLMQKVEIGKKFTTLYYSRGVHTYQNN